MATFGLGRTPTAASAQEEIEPSTPWIAAADGKLPLLQSALSTLNLPLSAADENGYTLLHASSSYGQIPVMQWILSELQQQGNANANAVGYINAADNEGDTAIHYAGSLDALRLLVEVGKASPFLRNKEGKTALEAKQEELKELVEDDEEDSDSEDVETLRQQVQYLSNLSQ